MRGSFEDVKEIIEKNEKQKEARNINGKTPVMIAVEHE